MYRWTGICPGWQNYGREYVQGGKKTGGNMSGVEKIWEGTVVNIFGRFYFRVCQILFLCRSCHF